MDIRKHFKKAEQCPYGDSCYRKNPEHVRKFHPEKSDKKEKPQEKRKQVEKVDKENEMVVNKPEVVEPPSKRASTSHEQEEPAVKRTPKIVLERKTDEKAIAFWKHAKNLNKADPQAAFSQFKNARLVGIFEQLNGDLDGLTDDELRVHGRFATDLPEMNTFLTCDSGRYATWRDTPGSEEFLVLHVNNDEHFPKMEMVGDSFEHMLVHLAGTSDHVAQILPGGSNLTLLRKQMKSAVTKRNKKKLGHAPNAVGLWVPVTKNDVGYREIAEDAGRIKRMLLSVGSTNDEEHRAKQMTKVMEIVAYVQFATDECDFGMGLEYGHWLFLANYSQLDRLAEKILATAYELLERDEFAEVLRAQFEKGRR